MPRSSHPPDRDHSQYFDTDPDVPSRPSSVTLEVHEGTFELSTDRGVFSPGRIDLGTRVLLDQLPAFEDAAPGRSDHAGIGGSRGAEGLPPGDLVDLGAGYGPIACTLALRSPERVVWAVEVNQRSRELCAANAAAMGVADRVRVVGPDEVPDELMAAAVVSNPPIRIGKVALHGLLERWLARLTDGGEAWLVVQKHLGADSLARWLGDQGWSVQRRSSRKGYRVLRVAAGPVHRVTDPAGD